LYKIPTLLKRRHREVIGKNETILRSKRGVYTTDDFTKKAIDRINQFDKNGNLMIVSYNAPHYPYVLPQTFEGFFQIL